MPHPNGIRGEEIALEHLLQKGFALIARNWKHRWLELDLVMQDQSVLVIVEVKTRFNRPLLRPETSIGKVKEKRLAEAAEFFLHQKQWRGAARFDVVSVSIHGCEVEVFHIQDAFYPYA